MSIALGDNIRLNKPVPDFDRQQYATVADMKAVKDLKMPDMYLAYCLETQKVYLYKKTNTVDATYGKWRLFAQSEYSPDSIQQEIMPEPSADNLGKVYQYVGPSSDVFKKGYFYTCGHSEEDGYFWVAVDTQEVGVITTEEIDRLFIGGL